MLGAIMVGAGCRAAVMTIHRVMDKEHGLGIVTGEILMEQWIKYGGKPHMVRTNPEGPCRDQGFDRGLAAKSIVDTLRDSCCWDEHPLTHQLARIRARLTAVLSLWDEAAKRRLRVKDEAHKACTDEELLLRQCPREIHSA